MVHAAAEGSTPPVLQELQASFLGAHSCCFLVFGFCLHMSLQQTPSQANQACLSCPMSALRVGSALHACATWHEGSEAVCLRFDDAGKQLATCARAKILNMRNDSQAYAILELLAARPLYPPASQALRVAKPVFHPWPARQSCGSPRRSPTRAPLRHRCPRSSWRSPSTPPPVVPALRLVQAQSFAAAARHRRSCSGPSADPEIVCATQSVLVSCSVRASRLSAKARGLRRSIASQKKLLEKEILESTGRTQIISGKRNQEKEGGAVAGHRHGKLGRSFPRRFPQLARCRASCRAGGPQAVPNN